ncbi:MAG TPA: dienelactone hydrolase family protein [Alphaproteobacteria bacterium]|nr:dienelactone hydrolase family protein [Alphaproteobacteria bacterium]
MDTHQDEIRTMAEQIRLGRRGFAVTSLAAGFALAVRPVSAATITTDTNGLTAGEVKIPVPDGSIPGYRAMPAGSTGAPTVLVIHEVFGVHEHIKDLCRRLAKAGYYAAAPLLYSREGDVAKAPDIQAIMAIVDKVKDDQVKSDLDSTAAFAKAEKADTAKLGVTGFCWGGRQTWLYVAANPAVKAGVAWYGPLVGRPGGPGPNPIDVADKIKGRVLGLYGGKDQMITAAMVDRMRANLKAAGDTQSQIIVYPDAQHGFNADYRPSYNEADAKDGWAKMLAWFKAHGAA